MKKKTNRAPPTVDSLFSLTAAEADVLIAEFGSPYAAWRAKLHEWHECQEQRFILEHRVFHIKAMIAHLQWMIALSDQSDNTASPTSPSTTAPSTTPPDTPDAGVQGSSVEPPSS